MTSVSHKDIVDDIIEKNGRSKEGGDIITHIIEYHNIFDRSPTWKLCRNKEEYKYAMETGAFINPFLMWERDDSDVIFPNSHNNYGVKDTRRKKGTSDTWLRKEADDDKVSL